MKRKWLAIPMLIVLVVGLPVLTYHTLLSVAMIAVGPFAWVGLAVVFALLIFGLYKCFAWCFRTPDKLD